MEELLVTQEHVPQLELELEEVPHEEVAHQVIEPQAGLEELPYAAPTPAPAPPGFPHLYEQLMQDIAKDPR
jgi:hypothetical protein